MSSLTCSIIIPSYNRRASLEMVLEGLERQTLPQTQFEVIVVLDGGTDDSAAMLMAWQQTQRLVHLRWHCQPNSGQAAARNKGVELAATPIVVFLDDDVVPAPDLIEVHLRHHADHASKAVLGDCLMVRETHSSLYHLGVWAWWEDMYYRRALPGRQPGYRDFCAGNVSLRREDFLRAGGFDTDFRGYGGEDYELGYRLLQAGVSFVADRQAKAQHYHRTTVAGVLRATRQEGYADVVLGRKHPELRAGLRLMYFPGGRYGSFMRTAVKAPGIGDQIAGLLQRLLPLFERTRMRMKWLTTFNAVRGYAYWRGVRDALGSREALGEYRAGALPIPHQTLDITNGLPAILPPIWVNGPCQLTITYQDQTLGTLMLYRHIEAPLHPYLTQQLIAQLGDKLTAIFDEPGQIDDILDNVLDGADMVC